MRKLKVFKENVVFSIILFLTVFLMIALVGCDRNPSTNMSSTITVPPRNFSAQKLELGKKVYETYCVDCHGVAGAGSENWRKRDASGKFPPPPLNGSGHTWHHPISVIKNQIYNGGMDSGGVMPAFGDKLNEQEIDAVISWIQSIWPQKVYNTWYEMQHQ